LAGTIAIVTFLGAYIPYLGAWAAGIFAALGIHPLAVLIVTIAGGSLFGAAGLILAAPLTSAVTRIASDLAAVRGRRTATQPSGSRSGRELVQPEPRKRESHARHPQPAC
jgi:predicted PurR-regulated permease PerM